MSRSKADPEKPGAARGQARSGRKNRKFFKHSQPWRQIGGDSMDEKTYRGAIEKHTKGLGVYRLEFTRARCRLAQIYVRIEQLNRAFQAGEFETTCITQGKNGPVEIVDPHIQELDRLNDQALAYEKALGLTADSARKLREDIFAAPKEKDPLTKALESAGVVMLNG